MRSNNTFPALAACFLGVAASAFALSTATHEQVDLNDKTGDPLFSRMVGSWTGSGATTYPNSGRVEQIAAQVESTVDLVNGEERLTSTNQIVQSASGVAPSSYQTVYWIEPESGKPGTYTLGYNVTTPGAPVVTSTGVLNGSMVFVVDQNLGGGYLIHSETTFGENSSHYVQTTTQGGKTLSRTIIQYERTAPQNTSSN